MLHQTNLSDVFHRKREPFGQEINDRIFEPRVVPRFTVVAFRKYVYVPIRNSYVSVPRDSRRVPSVTRHHNHSFGFESHPFFVAARVYDDGGRVERIYDGIRYGNDDAGFGLVFDDDHGGSERERRGREGEGREEGKREGRRGRISGECGLVEEKVVKLQELGQGEREEREERGEGRGNCIVSIIGFGFRGKCQN